MYLVGFLLGGVIAIFFLSKLVGAIVFRKVSPPKKEIFSIGMAFILATVLAGYGLADGGPPKFLQAATQYGLSSIILLAIQMTMFSLKKKRPKGN